jgi:hypothetical protein
MLRISLIICPRFCAPYPKASCKIDNNSAPLINTKNKMMDPWVILTFADASAEIIAPLQRVKYVHIHPHKFCVRSIRTYWKYNKSIQ